MRSIERVLRSLAAAALRWARFDILFVAISGEAVLTETVLGLISTASCSREMITLV